MIKPLTSLRFIFALFVFVSHLDFLSKSKNETLRVLFKHIFFEGYIGVSFFFILSGFILAYKYQIPLLRGEKDKIFFWKARFARIYPLHLLTLFLSIPLVFSEFFQNQIKFILKFLINLILIQSFFPQENVHYSFNAPSWSISDEAFFYLLFPFFIYLFLKQSKRFYCLLLLSITIVFALFFIVPQHWQHFIFYIFPPIRFVDFMLGIALFNLFSYVRRKKPEMNFSKIEWFSILLFILFFWFHEKIPLTFRYSIYYWLPISLIIFSFAFQQGKISRFLSHRFFFLAGEISYGFYMFHQLVIRYFLNYLGQYVHSDLVIIVVIFIITLLISYLSFQYYERPLNRFVRNI